MAETIIPIQSEYEKLLEAVKKLRTRVIELTAERDDLLYHICPALQAKYDENIASVERELLAAQMYLKEKQRVIEILQAQLNRQEKPSMKEAEKKAHEEFRAYEEELKKKAGEARRFREHWENETQWSRHEQESRDRKKENRTEQSAEADATNNKDHKTKASSASATGTEEETHKRIGVEEDEDPTRQNSEGQDPTGEKDTPEVADPDHRHRGNGGKPPAGGINLQTRQACQEIKNPCARRFARGAMLQADLGTVPPNGQIRIV